MRWFLWVLACMAPEPESTDSVDSGVVASFECPDGRVVEGGPCLLQGQLPDGAVLRSDVPYQLGPGFVFVGDGEARSTLAIEPGTVIEAVAGAALIVRPGSQLFAVGRPDAPIVFTSAQPEGQRSREDWVGLVLLGRAPVSCPEEEPGCTMRALDGVGSFGGIDDNDDSGVLRYVRTEFTGGLVSPCCPQTPGIGLFGVGRATEVDFVQAHEAAAEGIYVRGGTVDLRHVVASGAGSDLFRWDSGWQGRAQFVVLQASPDDGFGDNGMRGLGTAADEPGDTPRSAPVLANVTAIGAPGNASVDRGLVLMDGTGADIWASQFLGFRQGCLDIDGEATFVEGVDGGAISIRNSLMACDPFAPDDQSQDSSFTEPLDPAGVEAWFLGQSENRLGPSDLDPASNQATPASPSFISGLGGGEVPDDPWFTPTARTGAVTVSDEWTDGWTAFPVD